MSRLSPNFPLCRHTKLGSVTAAFSFDLFIPLNVGLDLLFDAGLFFPGTFKCYVGQLQPISTSAARWHRSRDRQGESVHRRPIFVLRHDAQTRWRIQHARSDRKRSIQYIL